MPIKDEHVIILLDKISEIGERTARMEVEQKNMREDLDEIKKQDLIQNDLLDEHIKGVNTANARLDNEIKVRKTMELEQDLLKQKVEKLEEPSKFLETFKKYLLYIAAVGGAGAAIHNWFKS